MRWSKLVAGLGLVSFTTAQDILSFNGAGGNGEYLLANSGTAPVIWVDNSDAKAVQRTAKDVARDFGRVVGTNGTTTSDISSVNGKPVIIAGTIGQSSIIDDLIKQSKLDVSAIKGKWESYIIQVVQNPVSGIDKALVVAGSDRRAVIWGLFYLSETMGVSPWYYWADVPIKTKTSVWAVANARKIQGSPSVKWRGIFINNENPSLLAWSTKFMPEGPYGSRLGDEFYGLVFELLLRLKANYMWPAMWGKMFYLDTSNAGQISDDYGIVMGTSHHEPMARSEKEQNTFMEGKWDWDTNQANVQQFMREGVRRGSNKETMYTVGMRGSGDAANPNLTPQTLEKIVAFQQQILREELNATNLYEVPQAWVLYTEVGKYYQGGMKVPDEVTLLWSDDNYGNILRIPGTNETNHGGGHGMYFHFDFNGGIRCYKWINTIQMIKTWEQMQLAFERGTNRVWITNIGDIKPLEIPTTHFLDMAYDYSKHKTPDTVYKWLRDWAAKTFTEAVASGTADVLTQYGILTVRRKYELLSNSPFAWSTVNYDEAEVILREWVDLLAKTQALHDSLSPEYQIPFFEMVLHPVLAGKTVIDLYIKAAVNRQYNSERRVSTNTAANSVQSLFAEDKRITDRYHSIQNGKWYGMVIQPHIGYTTWSDPPNNIMPSVTYLNSNTGSIIGVAASGGRVYTPGGTSSNTQLLSMDSYAPQADKRWVEVFARKNGTFSYSTTSNTSYVKLSQATGNIKAPGGPSDIRSLISVDWKSAPNGRSTTQITIKRTDSGSTESVVLTLPLEKRSVPSGFKGFVESGGVVSMEVDHYTTTETKNGLSYMVLPGYGRTRAGLKIWPVTSGPQTPSTGPKVSYSFYTFSTATQAQLTVHLGTSINHDPSRPLRYAFAIDNGVETTVQPVPTHAMGSLPTGHTESTIAGGWASKSAVPIPAGAHTLNLWLLEPGVVIQKLVLDVGGLRTSAQGPPESVRV